MLTLLTAPAVEPVSVNEAKAHARIGIIAGQQITSLSRTANVVTAVVPAHGLQVGQQALVDLPLDASFGGLFQVATVADANTVTWAQAGTDAATSGGTIAPASPEDSLIADWIKAAREEAENYTHTALITQKWRYSRDGFPRRNVVYEGRGDLGFYLPKPPFQSVSLFQYIDMAGATQTLTTPGYQVNPGDESRPARILPAYLVPWPVVRGVPNNVMVEFLCGYGATGASVPAKIRQAIRKTVSDWYYNRERVGTVPEETCELLSEYRNLIS